MQDSKKLEGMLRKACQGAGYTEAVEMPTRVAQEFAALLKDDVLVEQAAEMGREALFKDRVPAAAARQLAVVLAWSAEEHLATLERLLSLKRASRSEVDRLRGVCAKLVSQCADLGVSPRGMRGAACKRLERELARLADEQAQGKV
jgi:hypothetical protein